MNVGNLRKRLEQYPYSNTICNDPLGTIVIHNQDVAMQDPSGHHGMAFMYLAIMALRDLYRDGIANVTQPCDISVADIIRILGDLPQDKELFDHRMARDFYGSFAEALKDTHTLPQNYRDSARECAEFIAEVLDFEDYEMGFDPGDIDLGDGGEFGGFDLGDSDEFGGGGGDTLI